MKQFLTKYKKTTIVILVALVMLVVLVLYKFIMNSAIDYIEVESDTIQSILNQTANYTEDERELSRRLANDQYEQEVVLSGNVNLGEFSQTSMLARSLLANSRLVMKSKHNPNSGEMSADLSLQLQRTNLLKAKLYQDELYTAVKLPLDPKPIGIKNDRLGDWVSRHYEQEVISEIPRHVNSSVDLNVFDYVKLFELLQEIDKKKESNVSYKDNVYQKITMDLSAEQTDTFKTYLLNQLDQTGSQVHERLINIIEQIRFPDGMTYEAYYNDEHVRYRELKGTYDYQGEVREFAIDFDSKITGEQYQVDMNIELMNEKNPFQMTYQSIGQPGSEQFQVNRQMKIHHNQTHTFKWDTIYRQGLKNVSFDVNLPMDVPRVEGDMTIKTNINKSKGMKIYHGDLLLGGTRSSIELAREINFTKEVDIEKINAKDVRFIDQLTNDEYHQWFQRFQATSKDYIKQIIRNFSPF